MKACRHCGETNYRRLIQVGGSWVCARAWRCHVRWHTRQLREVG